MEKLFVIKDICKDYKLSEKTIRRAIKSGKLKATKPGREWMTSEANIQAYFEACSNTSKLQQRGCGL